MKKAVFFLPVNILTVCCAGFLGHTTRYRDIDCGTFRVHCVLTFDNMMFAITMVDRLLPVWGSLQSCNRERGVGHN